MKSIDVAVDVLVACGNKVPTIAEGDAVTVLKIEAQAQIGVAAREELGEGVVLGKQHLKGVGHADAIANIGKIRTIGHAKQR